MNRINLIKQARPREASQAPKVRRISIIIELIGEALVVASKIAVVMERIIPSRANSAIRRCFRCNVIDRRAASLAVGSEEYNGRIIARRRGHCWFTRPEFDIKLF